MPCRRSPLGLIQEDLRYEPWRLLVACLMLNQTSIRQVRPVIWTFFARWPTPEDAAEAGPDDMAETIRSLGLQRRRAGLLIRMSRAYTGWLPEQDVLELPGVGKYAADSYNMFIRGNVVTDVTDKELRKYVDWAVSNG